MERFFIQIKDGDRYYTDRDGVRLANVDLMLSNLQRIVREIIDDEGGPSTGESRVIEVYDDIGRVALSLPFATIYSVH